MAGYSTPYPPPPSNDWKQQRRVVKEQARMQRDMLRARRDLYRQQLRAARRSSILGPLVLIAIGVIFLLIQLGHLQGMRAWDWYARWWPLLLVGSGVVVLAEWAFDQFTHTAEKPAIRRGLGGLWVIFTLIIITGIFSNAVRNTDLMQGTQRLFFQGIDGDNLDLNEFFGDKHETDQPFTQAFPAGASLTIDSPRGGINVSGTSDDGQMHIQLHRAIYTGSDSDAASKAQQLVPKIETAGSRVSLSLPSIAGAQADMTITVPANTPLTLTTSHGPIDVSAIKAPVSLTSSHGDIGVSAVTGAVTAHIRNNDSSFAAHSVTGSVMLDANGHDITMAEINGPVTVTGNSGGSAHLEHIRGAASYHSSRTQFDAARLDGQFDTSGNDLTIDQAVGPVTLTTFSYNIMLERIAGNVTVNNRNGSVDLTSVPPLGNVTIEDRNGTVNLTVPEHAGFSIEASTTNGQISTDFPLAQQDRNNRNTLNGTVGSGGAILRVTTSQGDISLKKADLQPLPPVPATPKLTIIDPNNRADASNARSAVREAVADARSAVLEARQDALQARRDAQQAAADARQAARDSTQ